jgi:hypothetical protein
MFVSTSLADLHESTVSQTGIRIFGYGLGAELERLKDRATDQTDLDFYLAFPNPLDSLEEEYRIYPFMITGPCFSFSNTSSPMFVTPLEMLFVSSYWIRSSFNNFSGILGISFVYFWVFSVNRI